MDRTFLSIVHAPVNGKFTDRVARVRHRTRGLLGQVGNLFPQPDCAHKEERSRLRAGGPLHLARKAVADLPRVAAERAARPGR